MVIDGHGISDGEIIHKAFALINYNKIEDNYNFRSNLSNGQEGSFRG